MKRYSIYNLSQMEVPPTLLIYSNEGDLFTVGCELHDGEQAQVVHDNGKPVFGHSVDELHQYFRHHQFTDVFLVTRTPYDEMIGTETHAGPIKTRLKWHTEPEWRLLG